MNPVTRLIQSIETMETKVTAEAYGQFSQSLSRIGGENKSVPAVMKLVGMMHTSGQYLGLEDSTARKEILDLLGVLVKGLDQVILDQIIRDPESKAGPAGQVPVECQTAFAKFKSGARPLVSPEEVEGLKAVILSVDWEISDETLKGFDQETQRLMTRLRFHRTLFPFLKIINSLGRYLASKKAAAHKDSISFLQSVFGHFEQVVQNPALPFKTKKQLVEQDISAFNAFKKKISSPGPGPEISLRPALSHVNAPRIRSGHTLTPLEASPDPEPALAAVTTPVSKDAGNVVSLPQAEDRDVMGDLFSPKESDADRLMDRIHMSLVTGEASAEEGADNDDPEGFENLVPSRMDQEPIPEISHRLDEFFNLDSPGHMAAKPHDSGPALEEALFEKEEAMPEKLIFLEPDETEDSPPLPLEKLELFAPGDDPVDAVMARLQSLVDMPDLDQDILSGAGRDLSLLKPLWQGDPDKSLLVDVAARLVEAFGEGSRASAGSDKPPHPEPGPETDPPLALEVDTEAEANTDPEADPDTMPDPDPDIMLEADPDTDPDSMLDLDPDPPRKFWQIFRRRRDRHER